MNKVPASVGASAITPQRSEDICAFFIVNTHPVASLSLTPTSGVSWRRKLSNAARDRYRFTSDTHSSVVRPCAMLFRWGSFGWEWFVIDDFPWCCRPQLLCGKRGPANPPAICVYLCNMKVKVVSNGLDGDLGHVCFGLWWPHRWGQFAHFFTERQALFTRCWSMQLYDRHINFLHALFTKTIFPAATRLEASNIMSDLTALLSAKEM